MTWVEAIGFLGSITNVWGNVMLARLKQNGWWVRLMTNVLWMIYAVYTSGGWPVLVNHATFFGLNIYGWFKWRRAQREGSFQPA